MADFIFNQAKGRIREFFDDAAGDVAASQIVLILLDASVADATAIDYDTISAVLGDASTTEAGFTNYARIDIEDADITVTVDDANDRVDIDIPDQTITSAGNGVNDTLTDVVFAFDSSGTDADSSLIPISQHDFVVTTDGSDLTIEINANGLLRAS